MEDVAAHDFGLEPLGDRVMADVAQFVARLAEQQIGVADQLMKGVQVAACAFDALKGLRHSADGLDRRVVHPVGAPVLWFFNQSHGV